MADTTMSKRELSGVFHAITGAGGRFKTGKIIDVKAEGLDVYNTMLAAMEVNDCLGSEKRPIKSVIRFAPDLSVRVHNWINETFRQMNL